MGITAVGGDFAESQDTGCWCCGDQTVRASLLRLGAHRVVGVCFRCIEDLNRRKRATQRITRHAPPGPWWQRLRYRAGFNRC